MVVPSLMLGNQVPTAFVPKNSIAPVSATLGRLLPNGAQNQSMGRVYQAGEIIDLLQTKNQRVVAQDHGNTWAFAVDCNQTEWANLRSRLDTLFLRYAVNTPLSTEQVNSTLLSSGLTGEVGHKTEGNADQSLQHYGDGSKDLHFVEDLLKSVDLYPLGRHSIAGFFAESVPLPSRRLDCTVFKVTKEGRSWRSDSEFLARALSVFKIAQRLHNVEFHLLSRDQQVSLLNIGTDKNGQNDHMAKYFRKFVYAHQLGEIVGRKAFNGKEVVRAVFGGDPAQRQHQPVDQTKINHLLDSLAAFSQTLCADGVSRCMPANELLRQWRNNALAESQAQQMRQANTAISTQESRHLWKKSDFTDAKLLSDALAPRLQSMQLTYGAEIAHMSETVRKTSAFLLDVVPQAVEVAGRSLQQHLASASQTYAKDLARIQNIGDAIIFFAAGIGSIGTGLEAIGQAGDMGDRAVAGGLALTLQAGAKGMRAFADMIAPTTLKTLKPAGC